MQNATLAKIGINVSPKEQKRITDKQEEMFNSKVASQLKVYTDSFLKSFKKSQDKARLIKKEIDTYEKLFFEEKLKTIPGEELNKFNSENNFSRILGIDNIRHIYNERIVQGKRNFTDVRSHFCRFGMGRDVVNDYVQVEAYFQYLLWLREYKSNYEILQEMINSTNANNGAIVNEFALLEKIINDCEAKTNYYQIFRLEHPSEVDSIFTNDEKDEYNPAEIKFFETIFKSEINRVKNAINNHIVTLDSTEMKSSYINLVYNQLVGLQAKNLEVKARYDEMTAFFGERVIHGHYSIEIHILQESIKKDFKNYLNPDLIFNNSDEKKFEHCILCRYHDKFKLMEEHKGHTCKPLINAIESAKKLLAEFSDDYIEQYDYIVSKWKKQNEEKGNNVNELSFIAYQLNRINTLFTHNEKEQTYSATDYKQKTFVFSNEFYHEHIAKIFSFIKNHLNQNKAALESTNRFQKIKSPSLNSALSFIYSGEDINLTLLHDNLLANNFILKTKDIRFFRKIFSGLQVTSLIIWSGTLNELHWFIKLLLMHQKIKKCSNKFVVAENCFYDKKENAKINRTSLRTATAEPEKSRLRLLENYVLAL